MWETPENDLTLALSINQTGWGKNILRRVDSNLRQGLGKVHKKRAKPLGLALWVLV